MSFALGELGLRLHEFYDMPWCEYLIKSKAYYRMQRDRLIHTRFIAYHAFIAPHVSMKSIPKIEKFMPIDGDNAIKKASEASKKQFRTEYLEYLKAKNK